MTTARVLLFVGLAAAPLAAADPIPVALYADKGAAGKGPGMITETLTKDNEFAVTKVTADDIRAGKLKDYRVLVVPGGSGSAEGKALAAEGRDAVKKFVADGGTFVGICAGCYLATCEYEWSLHILPAKVVDRANWMRGRGDLPLALTAAGKEWLARPADAEVTTIYHNGPVLEAKDDAKEKLVPLAVFKDELVKKGAKEGLMKGSPAIAAARYGSGWAVGVSPHPEQTDGVKDLVPAAVRWTLTHPVAK